MTEAGKLAQNRETFDNVLSEHNSPRKTNYIGREPVEGIIQGIFQHAECKLSKNANTIS